MKNKLPIAKEFPYSIIGSWTHANPFCIAFVYPRNAQPCIVKGGLREVEKYIPIHFPASIAHITMWQKKVHRETICFFGLRKGINAHLFSPTHKLSRGSGRHGEPIRWKLSVYEPFSKDAFVKYMRKPPRSWMKELDPFIDPIHLQTQIKIKVNKQRDHMLRALQQDNSNIGIAIPELMS